MNNWYCKLSNKLSGRAGLCIGVATLTIIFAAGAANSMVSSSGSVQDEMRMASSAEQLFADAPDGVDPMVTGPVSASLKKRQAENGCFDAKWPNIPLNCYPN